MSSRLSKCFSSRRPYIAKLLIKCVGRRQILKSQNIYIQYNYWTVCSNKQKKTSEKEIKIWRWEIQLWESKEILRMMRKGFPDMSSVREPQWAGRRELFAKKLLQTPQNQKNLPKLQRENAVLIDFLRNWSFFGRGFGIPQRVWEKRVITRKLSTWKLKAITNFRENIILYKKGNADVVHYWLHIWIIT